jgi:hypothetical protein
MGIGRSSADFVTPGRILNMGWRNTLFRGFADYM